MSFFYFQNVENSRSIYNSIIPTYIPPPTSWISLPQPAESPSPNQLNLHHTSWPGTSVSIKFRVWSPIDMWTCLSMPGHHHHQPMETIAASALTGMYLSEKWLSSLGKVVTIVLSPINHHCEKWDGDFHVLVFGCYSVFEYHIMSLFCKYCIHLLLSIYFISNVWKVVTSPSL